MREIKFRVWDKDSKTMYSSEVIDTINFYDGTVTCSSGGYNEIEWDCDIDNSVLMQYTGFKDDDGTEIYEGDILEGLFPFTEIDGTDKVGYAKGKIFFDEAGTWKVKSSGYTDDLCDWMNEENTKVIGNIYETPGMFEEEREEEDDEQSGTKKTEAGDNERRSYKYQEERHRKDQTGCNGRSGAEGLCDDALYLGHRAPGQMGLREKKTRSIL